MKSKLRIIVLSLCAFFLAAATFYAQDDSAKEQNDGQEQEQSNEQAKEQDSGRAKKSKKRGKKSKDSDKSETSGAEDDEDAPDVYDDNFNYVYMQNAPGDQYINVRVMPNFPLNFDDKLTIGGQITVGYSRFLTSWFAVGAELAFGYNPTIGSNIFTYIPMTVGVTFLPAIKKFEFPITVNVGAAVENYLSNTYFPGLVVRGGVGAYFRINESWSAGVEGFLTYMPQWYFKEPEKNDYLIYASASAGVKYHF